jgi:hypothetical protein
VGGGFLRTDADVEQHARTAEVDLFTDEDKIELASAFGLHRTADLSNFVSERPIGTDVQESVATLESNLLAREPGPSGHVPVEESISR